MTKNRIFESLDYILFALMLCLSTGIGIFFGCFGKKQETTRDLLIANRGMGVIPVSMSLFATFISGVTILGSPLDIFNNDIMFLWSTIGYTICTLITSQIFAPFFIELGFTSAYEFLEKRFDRKVKLLATITFIINTVIYLSFVLYGPAFAIKEATDMNLWVLVITIGVVSTFYTAVGGMVTVMWTDVFQVSVMFVGLIVIALVGLKQVGGISRVFEINQKYKRIYLLNFSLNPTERHTVWSLSLGCSIQWLGVFGCNQLQVQRYLSASSVKVAKRALYLNLLAYILLIVLLVLIGEKPGEQLFPQYIKDAMINTPVVSGLFLCLLFSAVLSTISSGLNCLSAVTLESFVKIFFNSQLLDKKYALISRLLCLLFGFVIISLSFLSKFLQNTLQSTLSLLSVTGGPVLGLFVQGMFFKKANSDGVFFGGIFSLILSSYLFIKASTIVQVKKKSPFNDNCTLPIFKNNSNVNSEYSTESVNSSTPFISYQWYGLIAVFSSILSGLILSYAINLWKSSNFEKVLTRFWKKISIKKSIKVNENFLKNCPIMGKLNYWDRKIDYLTRKGVD